MKKPESDTCIEGFFTAISQAPNEKALYKFLGHIVSVLNTFPEHKEAIYSRSFPSSLQRIMLRSVILSKHPEEATSYVERHNLSADYQEFLAQEIVPLHQ